MVEGAQLLYVATAYAVAGAILLGLVLWAVLDYRAQRGALAELERRGGGWRREPAEPGPREPAPKLPARASQP